MILATCPACRVNHQVVGPSRLSGQDAQRTYDLTHCAGCETSSGLFVPLLDVPDTPAGEFGFPAAVVPVFDGKYGDWAYADDAQISTCAQVGLRASLVHRLAAEMCVPLSIVAHWVGLHDAETLSSPARKALKPGVAENLLNIAKLIGLVQLRADHERWVATFEAAQWMGTWLQKPHLELGGGRPGDYLRRPQHLLQLSKLLARIELGAP